MKNTKKLIAGIALCALFGFSTLTTPVYGASAVTGARHELYTISGFMDLLISRGIIPEDRTERARELVMLILQTESADTDVAPAPASDVVEVSVSQYIEHGARTYSMYQNIEGLILIAKNTSETSQTLEAKRNCQVTYRIYNESDTLLYNSADEASCQTKEKVTYSLGAGQTRIFPVTHARDRFGLEKGTYRFELEYSGYGKGEREVTVE